MPHSLATSDWPVIGQFSSVGTLGASADSWMCGELLESLGSAGGGVHVNKTLCSNSKPKLKLVILAVNTSSCFFQLIIENHCSVLKIKAWGPIQEENFQVFLTFFKSMSQLLEEI